MNLTKVITLAALLSATTACVTPQYQKVPAMTGEPAYSIGRSSMLDTTNYMTVHLNEEKDILYFQNFGGGGVALGVMLGPVGTAANIKMIESNTLADRDVLSGKIGIDPKACFLKAAANTQLSVVSTSGSGTATITPYVYATKTDNETIQFASALLVDYGPLGTPWVGKYMHQVTHTHGKDKVAAGLSEQDRAALEAALISGFEELLKIYRDDRSGKYLTARPVTFKSDFVTPRILIELHGEELSGEAQRVAIRTVGGVYSLPRDKVTVTPK